MSSYGVQKSNAVYVHEFTEYGDFLVSIKDDFGEIWYYDRFRMLEIVGRFFALQMFHTGSIYVLGHLDIVSQNWEIL